MVTGRGLGIGQLKEVSLSMGRTISLSGMYETTRPAGGL